MVSPTRRSTSRMVGTMAAGLVPTIYLYACAARPEPAPPPLLLPTISQPIQPAATPTPSSHVVKASWYGPGMAGRITTSGEVFNPRALTAASRTLPLGSIVKVTNPQNGKSVNVRINDRGPFVRAAALIYRNARPKRSASFIKASRGSEFPGRLREFNTTTRRQLGPTQARPTQARPTQALRFNPKAPTTIGNPKRENRKSSRPACGLPALLLLFLRNYKCRRPRQRNPNHCPQL